MNNLKYFILTTPLALIFLAFSNPIEAQNVGSLDSTFGTRGIVNYQLGMSQYYRDSLVQPDKKIVVAANWVQSGGGTSSGVVLRFNENGTFDQSFFNNGFSSAGHISSVNSVALQPDGKILIGGRGFNGGLSVVRFNANGSKDTTFGTNGSANTNFGSSMANVIKILPDGKIIAAGWADPQFNSQRDYAVVKFNADGILDATFGNTGIVITDLGSMDSQFETATDMAIQTDGKIIVVGNARDSVTNDPNATILRYNPNGLLDTTFGTNGKTIRNGASISQPVKTAIQTDGKIIVAASNILPVRYNSDGSLDKTFDALNWNYTAAVKIQPDGKILFSGYFGNESIGKMARYKNDGTLDSGFGTDGKITTNDFVVTISIAPDGKIVTGTSGLNFQINLARYLNNLSAGHQFFDFDGDGKTDVSIFRPPAGQWWINRSSNGQTNALQFGASTDKPVPADFSGDGKTDLAIFRPSTNEWFILRSEDNSFYSFPFGASGDIPLVGDFDGDGKADPTIFRPSTREWFVSKSSGGTLIVTFGVSGDQPVLADYDGDGKTDFAIYRPSVGQWWISRSSNGSVYAFQFGTSTDKPVQGDYTGDGKADSAIFRPSTGEWFILRSEDSSFYSVPFGTSGDLPAPGDYDGDGKTDTAVFRPSNNTWYVNRSTAGILIAGFGTNGDKPLPNVFVP